MPADDLPVEAARRSISAPNSPEEAVSVRLDARRQAVKDGLTHLLRLGGDQREDWLDRRQPPPDERANWWRYLLLVIDRQLGGRPDRQAAWVDLKLWLLCQGSARGILTPIEIAEKTAYFVAGLRPAGSELAVVLPSADDVVQACLVPLPSIFAPSRRPGRHLAALSSSAVGSATASSSALRCTTLDHRSVRANLAGHGTRRHPGRSRPCGRAQRASGPARTRPRTDAPLQAGEDSDQRRSAAPGRGPG